MKRTFLLRVRSPMSSSTPSAKTIYEFKNGKKLSKEDQWKSTVGKKQPFTKAAWKGKTIFKLENRTSVKVRSASAGPRRRGKPDAVITPLAPRGEPSTKSGGGVLAPVPHFTQKCSEDHGRSSGGGIFRPVPEEPERVERPAPPEGGEDEEDDFPGIEKLFEPYEHEEVAEEPQPAPPQAPQPAAPAGSEALEPRRIALPLPGQEVSRASPAFQQMLEKLRNEVELYKLHVKHYHMSPAQFRRRT